MSARAVAAFLKKVAEDETMQRKLIEFASEHGFDFTAEELSDADLDTVAGGLNITSAQFQAGGSLAAFSDVCKTPSPGGPTPIPYPNTGSSSSGSKSVKSDTDSTNTLSGGTATSR